MENYFSAGALLEKTICQGANTEIVALPGVLREMISLQVVSIVVATPGPAGEVRRMTTILEVNNVGLQQRKLPDTIGAATIISCIPIRPMANAAGGACLMVQLWDHGTKILVAELAEDEVGEMNSPEVTIELIRLQGIVDLVDELAMSSVAVTTAYGKTRVEVMTLDLMKSVAVKASLIHCR